jgi:hypothetical protein
MGGLFIWSSAGTGPGRDNFVVDRDACRTGQATRLWETRLLGGEVRKNQPYFVNI